MPEYVGFVFANGKRQVDAIKDRFLVEGLNPEIRKVGVFVNETAEAVLRIVKEWKLDVVQLHGEESPSYAQRLGVPVWKAFAVRTGEDLLKIHQYKVQGILLDGATAQAFGGTGQCFDWRLLSDLQNPEESTFFKGRPLRILAGGLTLENVQEACSIPGVDVLDVSSGVETDGWKDPQKIIDFVNRVRSRGDE